MPIHDVDALCLCSIGTFLSQTIIKSIITRSSIVFSNTYVLFRIASKQIYVFSQKNSGWNRQERLRKTVYKIKPKLDSKETVRAVRTKISIFFLRISLRFDFIHCFPQALLLTVLRVHSESNFFVRTNIDSRTAYWIIKTSTVRLKASFDYWHWQCELCATRSVIRLPRSRITLANRERKLWTLGVTLYTTLSGCPTTRGKKRGLLKSHTFLPLSRW